MYASIILSNCLNVKENKTMKEYTQLCMMCDIVIIIVNDIFITLYNLIIKKKKKLKKKTLLLTKFYV